MSELEQHQPQAVTSYDTSDLSSLAQWALDAKQAFLVAQSLATTAFVPAAMKGKPAEITAAILTGQEIGLQPMSALRSIDIIQGTPAMRANALRGLVQSRGHEVWVVESTETRAVVAGQRHGSEREQRSVWTTDRAHKLGLTVKDNWKKQPGAMLIARATAEVCRLIASDVLLGMPYAVEELDEAPAAAPKKTRRAPVDAPAAVEPDLPTPEPAAPAQAAESGDEPPLDWPEPKGPPS